LDGAGQDLRRLEELAADVDVDVLRADRVSADQRALDELVRRPADQLAVLEGARLGIVRVDEQVVRLAVVLGHEAPLDAGREAGAAAAAQPALLDHLDDLIAAHAERLLERLVAVPLLPTSERPGLRVAERLTEDARLALVPVRVRHGLLLASVQRRSEEHTSELQSRENLVC